MLHISYTFKRVYTFIRRLYFESADLHRNAVYSFSCINVYKMPDDGLLLEPKHVATNKLEKRTSFVSVI